MVEINELKFKIEKRNLEEQLSLLSVLFSERILFTTSFGIEDQVIAHLIFTNNIPVKVATLDTGRLFPETYKVFNETIKKYHRKIDVYFPCQDDVERLLTEKGPYSFYYSRENRIECCRYRKILPLNRALEGIECWISGIRSDQSDNRSQMEQLEYDDSRKLVKFYPLFGWSFEQVVSFARENSIPYNVLHDRGYLSIGCEPCTRAIKEGEDFRAGRWWWENGSEKECGLHIK